MFEEIEYTYSETTPSEKPDAKINEDRLWKIEKRMYAMFNNFQKTPFFEIKFMISKRTHSR
ncbi:unnamed protein product [Oikopleura dioica]|uniref:Uncharacterized protein n=1 Tax=Oikopleura dioica TaxID=34765 RepID=E4Y6T5_OIKDI|nr:unnamed protein product [Oikopleura dioica]